MNDFNSLGLPTFILEQLAHNNITAPTAIQHQSIPPALEGSDILASSQTGSGKTLAYLIPLALHILNGGNNKALILLPTREIALQVRDSLMKILGKMPGFNIAVLIGGERIVRQFGQLKRDANIIIGTPGRICDHLDRRTLKLDQTNFLVLDEVDRMLDMGFSEPLQEICDNLSAQRQTLMFTATLPKSIEKLAQKYLNNPARIAVNSPLEAAADITQETMNTSNSDKFPLLLTELQKREGSVLIFVKTKRGADQLADKLRYNNHTASAIHGDLEQSKRTHVLKGFRLKHNRIMVATDVAARGIDVPHIEHVINYDLPMCPEDYVHRIGRTGRAGAKGQALSLITPEDNSKWRAIKRFMNPNEQHEDSGPRNSGRGGRSDGGRPRNQGGGFGGGRGRGNSVGSSDGGRPPRGASEGRPRSYANAGSGFNSRDGGRPRNGGGGFGGNSRYGSKPSNGPANGGSNTGERKKFFGDRPASTGGGFFGRGNSGGNAGNGGGNRKPSFNRQGDGGFKPLKRKA